MCASLVLDNSEENVPSPLTSPPRIQTEEVEDPSTLSQSVLKNHLFIFWLDKLFIER